MSSFHNLSARTRLLCGFLAVLGLTTLLTLHGLTLMHDISRAAGAGPARQQAALLYADARLMTLAALLLVLVAGLLLAWWLARGISAPLQLALHNARRLAAGELDITAPSGKHSRADHGQLLAALEQLGQILRHALTEVRDDAALLGQTTNRIMDRNHDWLARTLQQAATLEQTAAAMQQLSATVKQNAAHAVQANLEAVAASDVALRGGADVARVVDTMGSINASSSKIGEIIGVIDGIAFQTNILALNAAVEAARAGEQGRGFAVVATEVRNLAHRSAAAAKEIKLLIDDTLGKVALGAQLADQAGHTMQDVVDKVRSVTGLIGEIASASSQQSTGLEQVREAITQLDHGAQQNAALVEQAATDTDAMLHQTDHLEQVLAAFGLTRAGAAMAGQTPAAPPQVVARAARPVGGDRPAPTATPGKGGLTARLAPLKPAVKSPLIAGPAGRKSKPEVDWEEF